MSEERTEANAARALTFELCVALALELLAPAPDGVEDQAHRHAALDLELEGVVRAGGGVVLLPPSDVPRPPQVHQHLCQPTRQVVGRHADRSDGADRLDEACLAFREVDVADEGRVEDLEEHKASGNDHLQYVVGGVSDDLSVRSTQVERLVEEPGGSKPQSHHIVFVGLDGWRVEEDAEMEMKCCCAYVENVHG